MASHDWTSWTSSKTFGDRKVEKDVRDSIVELSCSFRMSFFQVVFDRG